MLDVASARNTSKVSDTAVALFLLLLNSIRRIELGESHVVSELKSGFFFIPLPMKRHILRLVVLISIFQVFVQVKVLASHLARVGHNSVLVCIEPLIDAILRVVAFLSFGELTLINELGVVIRRN